MKMKLMKLMTVTALATAAVFGSFVESAEARSLSGYSPRGENATDIEQTFFLVDETPDGQSIIDETIDADGKDTNPNLGRFINAIEDFNTYKVFQAPATNASIDFDNETKLPLDREGNIQFPLEGSSIEFANLEARLIKRNNISSELEFIVSDDFMGDIIVYSLLEKGNTESVLGEFFLLTDRALLSQVLDVRPNSTFPNSLFQQDREFTDLAVNSLKDIFDSGLLGLTATRSQIEGIAQNPTSGIEDGLFFEGLIVEDSSTAIPESNATAALLIFSALGIGLKCKLR